jgi:hypothetical protein
MLLIILLLSLSLSLSVCVCVCLSFCHASQTTVLIMVAFAALSPTLGASIYNPAFEQLREQLGATDTELSLSVSLFILFQGGWPICKCAVVRGPGKEGRGEELI